MKRIWILLCLILLPLCGAENVLIWEASLPEYHGKVYLAGSIHIGKKEWYPLDKVYDDTLAKCEAVYFEIFNPSQMEAAQTALQYACFLDGSTLSSVLGYADFQTVCTFFRTHLALSPEILEKMRPWILHMEIAQLYMRQHPEISAKYGFEKVITEHLGKKPGFSLETLQSQFESMSSISDKVYGRVLVDSIRDFALAGRDFERIEKALICGNMTPLHEMNTEMAFKYPQVYRSMLVLRNACMAPKILNLLKKKQNVFVLVGAAHFAGNGNILEELRKRNVLIRQLKKTGQKGKLHPDAQ